MKEKITKILNPNIELKSPKNRANQLKIKKLIIQTTKKEGIKNDPTK